MTTHCQSAQLWASQVRKIHFGKFCIANIFLTLSSNFSTCSFYTWLQIFLLVPLKVYRTNQTYLLQESASNMSHVINTLSPYPFLIFPKLNILHSVNAFSSDVNLEASSVLQTGLGLLGFASDLLWIQNCTFFSCLLSANFIYSYWFYHI